MRCAMDDAKPIFTSLNHSTTFFIAPTLCQLMLHHIGSLLACYNTCRLLVRMLYMQLIAYLNLSILCLILIASLWSGCFYLKGTLHHGLYLRPGLSLGLTTFSYFDWGGDRDGGRSTISYVVFCGSNFVGSLLIKSLFHHLL